jgi:nucleoid-associated protein YgaU
VLGAGDGLAGERLEDIAFLYYGDPSAWRVIAAFNGIDDPARVPAGTLLRIPPQSLAVGA